MATPFDDLIPQQTAQKADPFSDLIPKAKAEFPPLSAAITDIPRQAVQTTVDAAKDVGKNLWKTPRPGIMGAVQDTVDTGKGVLGALSLPFQPVAGALQSLIGHPMANAEHAIGQIINPEVAAKDNQQEMYDAARGHVDTAMSGLGVRPGSTGPLPRPGKVAPPSVDELKTAARGQYRHPDVQAVQINPTAAESLRDFIKQDLENGPNSGFRATSQPGTFAAIEELANPAATSARAAGAPLNVSDVDAVRKVLGRVAKESMRPSDAEAAKRAITHIDDFITNLKPPDLLAGDATKANAILQDARGNWGAGARAQEVANTRGNAELNAASSHSGANIDNATRQAFKPLLKDDAKRLGGYSDAEVAARDKIVRGTLPANAARAVGSVLGGGGGLGALAAGGAGYAAAGPMGVAAPAAGWLFKQMGNRSTAGNVAKLDEMLRSRSPLHQSNVAAAPTTQPFDPRHAAAITSLMSILSGKGRDNGPE